MKFLFAAVALVAVGSVANAAEVKKETKAPVVASKVMTDFDMERVIAGTVLNPVFTLSGGHSKTPDVRIPPAQAQGLFTALSAGNRY
jgi:hypothetical protein